MGNKLRQKQGRLLLLPLLAALSALTACPAGGEAETSHVADAEIRDVRTTLVESRDSSAFIELTGTVTGRSSVPLTTKLMSEITQLVVEEGQVVSQGQVLVMLDDSDIAAMRSEAAAYRAEARAALGEVEAVQSQAEAGVLQAEAGLAQATAALADAELDEQRMALLFAKDVVARSQLDKAELGVKLARESVQQAEAGVAQARAGVQQAGSRTPQVEAKQKQAEARDMQAAAMQEYAVLRAPFDGIVSARYFEQGQLSVPGQPILVLEPTGVLRVRLALPDKLAAGLTSGDSLDVEIDTPEGSVLRSGTLVVLGASADPASRTVLAELELNDSTGLLSGQFVRVRVPGSRRNSLGIPASAVVREGELSFVWRVSSGGLLTKAPVDLGASTTDTVEIVRGISAGDRVVVNPGPGLYAGARIAASSGHEEN